MTKKYSNPAKTFWGYLSKSKYFRFKYKSVIEFLVVDLRKTYELYWLMCDVYREACFSQEKV